MVRKHHSHSPHRRSMQIYDHFWLLLFCFVCIASSNVAATALADSLENKKEQPFLNSVWGSSNRKQVDRELKVQHRQTIRKNHTQNFFKFNSYLLMPNKLLQYFRWKRCSIHDQAKSNIFFIFRLPYTIFANVIFVVLLPRVAFYWWVAINWVIRIYLDWNFNYRIFQTKNVTRL